MSDLPVVVEAYIKQHFPDIRPGLKRQLLRYTRDDREQVMLDVLQQSGGSLRTVNQLITQRMEAPISSDNLVSLLANELPLSVAHAVIKHFPELSAGAKRQLLRYTNQDREQVMLDVLEKSSGSLQALNQLVTQCLASHKSPIVEPVEPVKPLEPVEPVEPVKPLESVELAVPASGGRLFSLRHYSSYNDYEIERMFTELDMSVQNAFKPEEWDEAHDLIAALKLTNRRSRRLVNESHGSTDRLRELIAARAQEIESLTQPVPPATEPPDPATMGRLYRLKHYKNYSYTEIEFSDLEMLVENAFKPEEWDEAHDRIAALKLPHLYNEYLIKKSTRDIETLRMLTARKAQQIQRQQIFESQFDDLIKMRFPDQQDLVRHLFARYPDRQDTFKAIVEKSAGDITVLRQLLKTWQDADDTPVDRVETASARLQEGLVRLFPDRKADVMEVLNRYHGPNAVEKRIGFVEQSEGRFLDVLQAVDQALFPEPMYESPDDSPYTVIRLDEDKHIAEMKAELLFEAALYVDNNLRRIMQVMHGPKSEAMISALGHYQFGTQSHRTVIFHTVILNLAAKDPQHVLELILLQKLGLRSYEESTK